MLMLGYVQTCCQPSTCRATPTAPGSGLLQERLNHQTSFSSALERCAPVWRARAPRFWRRSVSWKCGGTCEARWRLLTQVRVDWCCEREEGRGESLAQSCCRGGSKHRKRARRTPGKGVAFQRKQQRAWLVDGHTAVTPPSTLSCTRLIYKRPHV